MTENKLVKKLFNSGLEIVLDDTESIFSVYMLDTYHNKKLNIRKFSSYQDALKHYELRCIGL